MKIIYSFFIAIYMIMLTLFYSSYINSNKQDNLSYISLINEDIENYIISVVACEMPALYNEESLKAQAIAARTFYYYELSHNNNLSFDDISQCYLTEDEMHSKWNDEYEKYYNKIRKCVYDTSSLVMYKNDELFKSFYFSTSNGYTEDSKTVFNEIGISSVSSEWDATSNNFKVLTKFKKVDLINILGNFTFIKINKVSSTNHVEEVLVDNKIYSGIEFRRLLNLRSTSFEIEDKNDYYYITTYGYGHGVGMSQYGSNYLANNKNYTYEDILNYYYQDIDIKRIN